MIDDKNFANEVVRIINLISANIEQSDIDGNIDIDLNGDILNLITEMGTFVINKQSAVKEIWLSSPVSGPYHFIYDGNKWKSRKGDELFQILSRDLRIEIKDSI